MDGQIFGPNVSGPYPEAAICEKCAVIFSNEKLLIFHPIDDDQALVESAREILPCLQGLQSGCEAEILLLMKEVDEAFQRKHIKLLEELTDARKVCISQKKEIDKLTALLPNIQDSQKEHLTEKLKQCSSDLEKLKKENIELKSENSALHQKAQSLSEMEHQLGSLKNSLSIQQEENKALREKLLKSEKQNEYLESIVNNLTSLRQSEGIQAGTKEADIAQTAEKFISEQKNCHENLISAINKEIENLDKGIRKVIT